FPLPVIVIAGMPGVPAADRPKFRAWASALAAALDTCSREAVARRGADATGEMWEYVSRSVLARRRHPGPALRGAPSHARDQGDRLSEEELIAMAILLLVAGHETTVNLIGNGILALLTHPDQMELLRRQPWRAAQAVEELLRYDPPVQMTARIVAEDVAFG